MKSIGSIVKDLNLNKIGLPEMLVALYPILSSYQYGPVPFSVLVILIILVIYMAKYNKLKSIESKHIKRLFLFFVLHEIALIFILGSETPGFFVNFTISIIIYFIGIIYITPLLNWKKFVGSINWVAIISLVGIIIQYIQVRNGQDVGMIKLPLLPESGLSRYHELYPRPHSFFQEPVMYSQFMLIPLFLALIKKQYVWFGIMALSVFMSSSTTGLVLVFVMLLVFMLQGKISIRVRALILIMGGGLIYLLINTDLFSFTMEKFDRESNITSTENVRLIQGPLVVSTMEVPDFAFGAPYVNAYQYCVKRSISLSLFVTYGRGNDATVYMTTFWQLILRFGVIGLLLYLMVYISLLKYKELLPLSICAIIIIYTALFWFGAFYVFYVIFMYSYAYRNKIVRNENGNNYLGKIQ